ncbi:MAG: rRNA maturation RNase YbeY [Lentisphaeria bacterium]|nr:rRNA maturation RNase YbeY [Lentisphaeria bacterium]
MKTIYSWRPEKTYPRPERKKLLALVAAAMEVTGSGIRKGFSFSCISESEMAEVNEAFVGHSGSTDVICFDYRQSSAELPETDDGEDDVEVEILVCPAVAAREAAKRALPYSRELVLYLVHGLLHAAGQDDLKPELKRVMRRKEAAALRRLALQFELDKLFPEPYLNIDGKRGI